MAKLITEYSQEFQINEADDKSLYIEGIFSSAELKNNNKRKYKKEILEREVNKVMEKVGNNCLWGELGHPPNPEINAENIAVKVESLSWQGNDLHGKAKVIDTPKGKIAKTLIREGKLGISSRGLGTVNEDGTIGPIGEVLAKAIAAKEVGSILFLVPPRQSTWRTYNSKKTCEKVGPTEICTIKTVPERVNIGDQVGIVVKEVSTIEDALEAFKDF